MLKRYLCGLGILFCSSGVQAHNLSDIYQLALTHDSSFQAANAAFQADQQSVPQAMARLLPQLSANYQHNHLRQEQFSQSNQSYSLELTQPILVPEYLTRFQQAKQLQTKATLVLLGAGQDLILRVTEQYFAVLTAMDDLHFSQAQRKAFARQLEQTQQRFDVGLIAITDVHEAKARYDNAITRELAANNQQADQYEKLREIIGFPIDGLAGLPIHQALSLNPPRPANLQTWVNTANQFNTDILSAHMASKIAKSELDTQKTGHLPSLHLQGTMRHSTARSTFNSHQGNDKTISLNASLPLFNGGAVLSKTKEAQARYTETLKKLELQQRNIESMTRQKYRGVLTNISEVKALAQAVISNQSALNATKAAYEVGTRTIVDVLDAQSNLLNARREHAKARYQYLLEGMRLKRAAGVLQVQDLEAINRLLTS